MNPNKYLKALKRLIRKYPEILESKEDIAILEYWCTKGREVTIHEILDQVDPVTKAVIVNRCL